MAFHIHLAAAPGAEFDAHLGELLARHMAAADVLGRLQIVRHACAKTQRVLPLATTSRRVRFEEDNASISASFDVGGDETAERIRNLTPVTKQVFDGLTSQYRRDAFTIAGAADLRLIQKIQDSLADAAQKGETAAEWKKAVARLTSDAGVADLNAFTLDTAFQTAMQKCYSAGRLEQMQEPHMLDALPFWQYWTVGDLRVRPEHAALDGFVARAIDPVWLKIYPPSGFNCRCSVVPISEDEALEISKNASESGLERLPMLARLAVPQKGFSILAAT
jgi:SPP1 gp7 family putative phage head morphogenesis protein